MTWSAIEACGSLIPAAPDCMLMMWVPRPLVVKGSLLLDAWGWDPLRVTEMIGLTSDRIHKFSN